MTLSEKQEKKRVNFGIKVEPGSQVFVAGTFNNWDPTASPLYDKSGKGSFKTDIFVPQGKHEYKFVVNGVWATDPSCHNRVAGPFGSENCVLDVLNNEINDHEPSHSGKKTGKIENSKDVELCRKR